MSWKELSESLDFKKNKKKQKNIVKRYAKRGDICPIMTDMLGRSTSHRFGNGIQCPCGIYGWWLQDDD